MDPHVLLECFSGTLEANANVRGPAEERLRQLSLQPGFLGACLDIVATAGVPAGCQKAAALYFKNIVVRYWHRPGGKFDEGEKPVIMDRIVGVLAGVDHVTQVQLVPVVRTLVACEYPRNWPELLAHTAALLQAPAGPGALGSLYSGVVCYSEVCRTYRWSANKDRAAELDPLAAQVFPHLLAVGDAMLALDFAGPDADIAAEIVLRILKAYKFVTHTDVPRPLQDRELLLKWTDFHCRVLCRAPPSYVLAMASEPERAQTSAAKCYKWAVANVAHIFKRHASRGLALKRDHDAFRELFVAEAVPHVMSVFLQEMDAWRSGARWLPGAAVHRVLEFLSHCVTQKETWAALAPGVDSIVAHIVYPLLCPTAETLELFEDDPADYINSKLDTFDDLAPDIAALAFVVTLVSKRRRATADQVVAFAVGQLSAAKDTPQDLQVAMKVDGALRLIGGVSHVLTLKESQYFPQIELFLAELVLPHLESPHEFVQARALDVVARFAEVPFANQQIISTLYQGVLRAFTTDSAEASLPVMLQSALAVQAFLPHEPFRAVLAASILPIMSQLLQLSDSIDNEAVAVVMQECVECFAPQLQPFGIDLMKSLVGQFLRLASEIKESSGGDVDAYEVDFDSDENNAIADKVTAALGLLNTMITVLLSFENSREVCMTLEETFSPVIEYVLREELDEFMAEIGELIENSIFLLRAVTPLMWSHVPLLTQSFGQGLATMYAEDLMPCLKNYMVFGCAHLAQSPDLTGKFITIILKVRGGADGDSDYDDLTLACELAQTLILALQHSSPPVIAELSKSILPALAASQKDDSHTKGDALTVTLVNYVISCLMYDCAATLNLLQQCNYLNTFFEQWFALVPVGKRVYDIKLFILGFMRVSNSAEVAAVVPSLTSHLGTNIASLFRDLPKALKNLEKQRTEFSAEDHFVDNEFGDFQDFDDEIYGSDEEGQNGTASTDNYREFLSQESSKLMDSNAFDGDDHVFEDVLGATPLDNVDPIVVFRDFSNSLQNTNPALYGAIFDNITDADRQTFIDVFKTS